MKKGMLMILAGLAILVAGVVTARAGNFGLLDLKAPQTSAGTFISMDGTGSAAGALVAVVTYRVPVSNNVFAAIGNGWVPMTIGGTIGAGLGGPSVSIGTGLNLLPTARAGLLGLIGAFSGPGALASLKGALQASDSPVALFVGPQYNVIFTATNKCHSVPTWFVGANITWE